MKTTKRFVALLMAVVMTFALGAVALAENGVFSNLPDPVSGNFSIPKGVIMINNTEGTYTRPAVKFDFDIISGDALTDEEIGYAPHVSGVNVYRGLPGGLKGVGVTNTNSVQTATDGSTTTPYKTSLEFRPLAVDNVNNNYGAITTEPLAFSPDMTAYAGVTQPGVYRYKVQDVTDAEYLKQVGISRDKDYDRVSYVDLYVQIETVGTTTTPSVAAIVVSQVEDTVPVRNSNGNIEATSTTETPATKEFDPGKVVVEDDGTVWTLTDENKTNPIFPTDYTETTYKATVDKGLAKTEDVFNDHPEYDFDDNNGDEHPDVDSNGVPNDKTNTEPAHDDKGDIIAQDETVYPSDEYYVDPTTGEIKKSSDDSSVEGGPKYAKYVGKYDYEQSDVYETFNVVLKKDTSGPMGDKTHEFPFKVTVNNNTAETTAQNLDFTYFKNSETPASAGNGSQDIATTLKHEDYFTIRGLNANATINVEETNDTSFNYSVTIEKSDKSKVVDAKAASTNGGKVKMADNAMNIATANTENLFSSTKLDIITFYNIQSNVSPTGVVLRFAPYILMLGAAFFFVALSRRRREQENA